MLVYYLWWRNPLDDCKMWVYMSEIAIYDEFYENFYTEKVSYYILFTCSENNDIKINSKRW